MQQLNCDLVVTKSSRIPVLYNSAAGSKLINGKLNQVATVVVAATTTTPSKEVAPNLSNSNKSRSPAIYDNKAKGATNATTISYKHQNSTHTSCSRNSGRASNDKSSQFNDSQQQQAKSSSKLYRYSKINNLKPKLV
jgi:hypothetical protein